MTSRYSCHLLASNIVAWVILSVTLAYVLAPIVFMFTASMMPPEEVMRIPYRWIPTGFHWQNYWRAIRGNDGRFLFPRNILNSFVVATAITIITVLLSTATGYGLAKFSFRGNKLVLMMIIAAMMVPFQVIMIPLYIIVTGMNLQNTYLGLIVPFLANAFGVFLMRQYLLTFPDELIDAARIDGAGEFQIFWRLILPNSLPAVITLAVLTFRTQWDNLIWPLLVAQKREIQTIPLYITLFAEEKHTDEGALMAAAVISSIPMIILFLTLSKHFVGGARLFAARKG